MGCPSRCWAMGFHLLMIVALLSLLPSFLEWSPARNHMRTGTAREVSLPIFWVTCNNSCKILLCPTTHGRQLTTWHWQICPSFRPSRRSIGPGQECRVLGPTVFGATHRTEIYAGLSGQVACVAWTFFCRQVWGRRRTSPPLSNSHLLSARAPGLSPMMILRCTPLRYGRTNCRFTLHSAAGSLTSLPLPCSRWKMR